MSLASTSSAHDANKQNKSDTLGGGAINEKKRLYGKQPIATTSSDTTELSKVGKTNFNPEHQPAHLLHALAGLERYPNYLSRWNYDLSDVDRLETALEEQLEKVRKQKQKILKRNSMLDDIREKVTTQNRVERETDSSDDASIETFDVFAGPQNWEQVRKHVLDPRAATAIFGSKQFRKESSLPTIENVLSGEFRVELDLALLQDWLDEEFYDVYSFPILSRTFCIKLKAAIKSLIDQSGKKDTLLEDFGRRPVDLDSAGFAWVNNLMFHLVVRPLSRELFGKTESFNDLDWRQGYIAGYSHSPSELKGAQRHRLVPHTDDSEVTMNIGMGDDDFKGGDLTFWNLRGTREEGNYVGDFHPQMGHAMLHSGRHLHEVKEVTSGDRFAMIIWARSWNSTRSTTCPCCWMMRRQDGQSTSNFVRHRCFNGNTWN